MAFSLVNIFTKRKPSISNEVITGISLEEALNFFTIPTTSGASVTAESASRAIPVKACVSLIAGAIGSMPVRIVRRDIESGEMVQRPADNHDLWWLLNEEPNTESTSSIFWEKIITDRLLRGRSYARILRKAGGRETKITELVHVPYVQVTPLTEWDAVQRVNRIKYYWINDGKQKYSVLPDDMLDFKGRESEQASGMSDILYSAREAIGLVLTIEEYCGKFFANGGTPRVVLKYPAGVNIDSKQQDALRDAWIKRLGGSTNASMPLVLQNGGDVSKISATAEEAQMLEARKFQVIEIARAFGVPPFLIGENEKTSSWGSGIEQLSQGFIRYTIAPHITPIEQELNRKLFDIGRYSVDFDEEALARGDMKSLGDWYRQALGGSQGPGFLTINEVRRKLKLAPIDGGEELYNPTTGANTNESGAQQTSSAAGDEPSKAETV
jgi:HK97 family phage portal protein